MVDAVDEIAFAWCKSYCNVKDLDMSSKTNKAKKRKAEKLRAEKDKAGSESGRGGWLIPISIQSELHEGTLEFLNIKGLDVFRGRESESNIYVNSDNKWYLLFLHLENSDTYLVRPLERKPHIHELTKVGRYEQNEQSERNA